MRKPANYQHRRRWQDAQRAEGRDPECGRESCANVARPAYVNQGTPLLYCATCAALINGFNPGACTLKRTDKATP